VFDECNFYYSRPGMADFTRASLREADLTRAVFRRATLCEADATGHLGQPNLDRADTHGAKGL
jgi:uncharacterized protein YjbI with pentapeptide repeats